MNDNTTTRERPATELEQLLNAPFTEHFASECEYEGTVRMGLLTGYGDVGGLEELMAREVDYALQLDATEAADTLESVAEHFEGAAVNIRRVLGKLREKSVVGEAA